MSASFPVLEKLWLQFSPVKPSDIILIYRQLALLLESGLSIVTALELLQEQATHRTLKKVLDEVIADLRRGNQLSASLNKHPKIFSPIHCQSLRVGEQTGGMETILRQVADYMEKQLNASKGVKNAMTYPVIAFFVAIAVVGVLVNFVFPAFNSLYGSLGAKLPPMTQFVINASEELRNYGGYILLGGLIAVMLAIGYTRTTKGKYRWDKLSLRFPMVGRVNQLNELSRLSRSISLLFRAGLPLTEILSLSIQVSRNMVMTGALMEIREDMLKGEGLSRPMSKHKTFLPMMVQMVRVGEETGNLDSTLLSVAQSYEAEAEDKTRSLIALIQPIMTIVIGLVVGMLALSLVSAMYSMYGQMG